MNRFWDMLLWMVIKCFDIGVSDCWQMPLEDTNECILGPNWKPKCDYAKILWQVKNCLEAAKLLTCSMLRPGLRQSQLDWHVPQCPGDWTTPFLCICFKIPQLYRTSKPWNHCSVDRFWEKWPRSGAKIFAVHGLSLQPSPMQFRFLYTVRSCKLSLLYIL